MIQKRNAARSLSSSSLASFFIKNIVKCVLIQKKVLLLHQKLNEYTIKKDMTMAPDQKKRHVVSYENMSEELANAFNEKYPKGFGDYLPDLVKYTKPDGTPFYAVTVETSDSIYLVKIKVKTDDAEELERWLEGEEEAENEEVAGAAGDTGDATLPDDNISQYGGDDGGDDA